MVDPNIRDPFDGVRVEDILPPRNGRRTATGIKGCASYTWIYYRKQLRDQLSGKYVAVLEMLPAGHDGEHTKWFDRHCEYQNRG